MITIRSQIEDFLKRNPLSCNEYKHIRKAGIIPFIRNKENSLNYCVMLPVASKPDLGLPEFQLCKGTRMFLKATSINGDLWQDLRGNSVVAENVEIENLAVTSLREGIEELGLRLDNIANIKELGEYSFTSATNHQSIKIWLLAAEIKNENNFASLAEISSTTSERAFMTLSEFEKKGRADHVHILRLAEKILYK